MPYEPGALAVLEPLTQVHYPVLALRSHRSLNGADGGELAKPAAPHGLLTPPKSQTLPAASVHETAPQRAPGILAAAATPRVPYTPGALAVLLPPAHLNRPARQVTEMLVTAADAMVPLALPSVQVNPCGLVLTETE